MMNDKIDPQKGIAYLAGKKELYIKIVNTFLNQKDAKIAELIQFFQAKDFDRLTIEFHGLKSSSATLGSTLLPEMALELELAGKTGDHELIIERFDTFIDQYRDTCTALEAVLSEL